jgi:predicted alpha/beta superfamily hydrolase
MNRFSISLLITMVAALQGNAQESLPMVVKGKLERIENFNSRYVSPRHVDIWLPEGYSTKSKYAVLYMHDGQMLYDPAKSWNNQAWNVDDTATELISSNKTRPFIIVGIWNGGPGRHTDYFPQQPFEELRPEERDTVIAQLKRAARTKETFQPQSDDYLRFITEELKPYIDKNFSVLTDRANTFIAGSSMGGLISMYAICEYPDVFGGAACVSTHWPGTFTLANNPIPDAFIKYLDKHLPNPATHKIYFDCGDQTLDALYPGIQKRVDDIMIKRGYTAANWQSKYFPGEDHSEKSWSKRLSIPFTFLLAK